MTSESYLHLRDSLVEHGSQVRGNHTNGCMAQCPHHEDSEASLSITDKGDRVLIHCHAGCQPDEILTDLGLDYGALFDGEPTKGSPHIVIRSYLYEDGYGRPWFWKDRTIPKSFRCRLPGTEPGDWHGIGNRAPILYHLPQLDAGIRAGKTVWLVDGEKDVETCERHGLVATTTPHGAGSRWLDKYNEVLSKAVEVVIVVDQDKAKPDGTLGTGQQHAVDARAGLRSVGVKVRLVAPAIGKDATDHFNAGYDETQFVRDTTASIRPRGVTGVALASMSFPELIYCITDVLPAGLAMLAGSPKAGKSWIALDFALGVAMGGLAMSTLHCRQGSVLYLAREDGNRRIKSRIEYLMRGETNLDLLRHVEIIPSDEPWVGGEQGLAAMTEWAEEVGNPRLVVLDTLAKVEPMLDDRDRYRSDYAMMSAYKRWADLHDCTVLMIHHLRKGYSGNKDDDDPFTEISGTRGITGAADTLMVLKAVRGTREGVLHITGRDVAEQSLELAKFGPLWSCVDIPDPV